MQACPCRCEQRSHSLYQSPPAMLPPRVPPQVLENSEGGTAGTLLAAVNNCVTPAGRRRLRQWLCRPLARIADIEARQDAVAALMGPAEEAAAAARTLFKGGQVTGGKRGRRMQHPAHVSSCFSHASLHTRCPAKSTSYKHRNCQPPPAPHPHPTPPTHHHHHMHIRTNYHNLFPITPTPTPPPTPLPARSCRGGRPGAGPGAHHGGGAGGGGGAGRPPRHPLRGRGAQEGQGVCVCGVGWGGGGGRRAATPSAC
jgi:hypothetical protein